MPVIPFLSSPKNETKKVVINRNSAKAFVQLAVNVLPWAACLTLVILNLKGIYAGPHISTTSLQFLAKLIKLLAQASICQIAFTYLRSLYIADDPVPFGALFAGLQITTLSYLWSLEFLGSVTSNSLHTSRKTLFAGFVVFNILLTAAIGPSIAVCLIPKHLFFSVATASVWSNLTEQDLFPAQLTGEHIGCLTNTSLGPCSYSALSAFTEVVRRRDPAPLPDINHAVSITADLGYIGPDKGQPSSPFYPAFDPLQPFIPSATTPAVGSLIAAGPILQFWRLGNLVWEAWEAGEFEISYTGKQPLAVATCTPIGWPISDTTITFPDGFNNSMSKITVDVSEIQNYQDHSDSWRLLWIDSPESLPNISLNAVVFPPTDRIGQPYSIPFDNTGPILTDLVHRNISVDGCSIMAGWATGLVKISFLGEARNNITSLPEKRVKISKDWAISLLQGWPDRGRNATPLDMVLSDVFYTTAYGLYYGEETCLASVIAQGMSHTPFRSWGIVGEPKVVPSDSYESKEPKGDVYGAGSSPERKHHLNFEIRPEGFAYHTKGFASIVSLAMLILYCAYVLIFALMITARPQTSSAWDSIAEMTALGIISRSTESLRNTSGGIESMETFRKMVSIRSVGGDHLEIVFEEDSRMMDTEPFEQDREY